jgi:putative acetyltransferase
VDILEDGLENPEVIALLLHHVETARAATAEGSAHALNLIGLRAPDVRFWSAWDQGKLLGVGALKRLSSTHAELKSMHTVEEMRGRGVGSAILRHIIDTARSSGICRISLETGASEYFEPARALYYRHGFHDCAPFGDYRPDINSVFLTLELS